MTIERLHQLLRALADREISRAHPLFEFSGGLLPFTRRWRTLRERQAQIFEVAVLLPFDRFLLPPDHPIESQAPGTWREAAHGSWHLPIDVKPEQVLDGFLHPGGWLFYLGVQAVAAPTLPDLYVDAPADIQARLESRGICVLIEAHANNAEWRVTLQPAAVPGVAAA